MLPNFRIPSDRSERTEDNLGTRVLLLCIMNSSGKFHGQFLSTTRLFRDLINEKYDRLWPEFTVDDQTYVEISNDREAVNQVEMSNPVNYRAKRAIEQWKKDYGSEVSPVDNLWREVFRFIFGIIISILDFFYGWLAN